MRKHAVPIPLIVLGKEKCKYKSERETKQNPRESRL